MPFYCRCTYVTSDYGAAPMFNGLNISHFSLMGNLNRLQREKKCRMKKVHNLLGAPEVCREIKEGFRKK